MKTSTITIRIDNSLKKAFQELCTNTNIDMSAKIHDLITNELQAHNKSLWVGYLNDIIKELGCTNVNFTENTVIEQDGQPHFLTSIRLGAKFTFKDFIEKHKNRQIYIQLGNEYAFNELRYIVI